MIKFTSTSWASKWIPHRFVTIASLSIILLLLLLLLLETTITRLIIILFLIICLILHHLLILIILLLPYLHLSFFLSGIRYMIHVATTAILLLNKFKIILNKFIDMSTIILLASNLIWDTLQNIYNILALITQTMLKYFLNDIISILVTRYII